MIGEIKDVTDEKEETDAVFDLREEMKDFEDVSVFELPQVRQGANFLWQAAAPMSTRAAKRFVARRAVCWAGVWCEKFLVAMLCDLFFAAVMTPTAVLALGGYVIYQLQDFILPEDTIGAIVEIFNRRMVLHSRSVKRITCPSQSSQDPCSLGKPPDSFVRSVFRGFLCL